MIEHGAEQAGADLLLAILEGRESVAIIEPSMTALPMTAIEGDGNSASPS
jgi:hypothetical protein